LLEASCTLHKTEMEKHKLIDNLLLASSFWKWCRTYNVFIKLF